MITVYAQQYWCVPGHNYSRTARDEHASFVRFGRSHTLMSESDYRENNVPDTGSLILTACWTRKLTLNQALL